MDWERVGVFAPRIEDAVAARRFAQSVLSSWGLRSDDAVLAVSELAANAFLHGGTVFTVTLLRDDRGGVVVEVADQGPAVPAVTATGWGLTLIDKLSKDWGFTPSPQGKVVWAVFDSAPL